MTVLYTPYDVATVLAVVEPPQTKLREVQVADEVTLVVAETESGFRVERLISTNPNAYLLPQYQPGQRVRLP